MKRLLFLLPLLAFIGLAFVFMQTLRESPRHGPAPSILVGMRIPHLQLKSVAGADIPTFTRQHLVSGKISVLNIFASWCAPCRVEHPLLLTLAEKGVVVYGIAYKDKPEDTRRYLQTLGNPYAALAADDTGRAGLSLGISGVPETFVVDGRGQILAHIQGPLNADFVTGVAEAAQRVD